VPSLAVSGGKDGLIRVSDFQGNRLRSEPLVFLNGCFSGRVFDVWDKSANLATALLNKGAAGCVVTMGLVEEQTSARASSLFYEAVLSEPESVTFGQALLRARHALQDEDPSDPMRLMFHFYGDPDGRLIYIAAPSDSALEFILKRA
jgi:hypothetical protein